MEAVFSRMGDVTVVSFVGRLDVEKAKSLHMNKANFHEGKVIFKLDRLSFVGSSGIQIFFQTLAEIQNLNRLARVTGVKPEFVQLIKFSKISNLAIDLSIEHAYGQLNGDFTIEAATTDSVNDSVTAATNVTAIVEEADLTENSWTDDPSEAA